MTLLVVKNDAASSLRNRDVVSRLILTATKSMPTQVGMYFSLHEAGGPALAASL